MIRGGLHASAAQERALETWLSGGVVAAYDAMLTDSSRGRSPDDVRAALVEERERVTRPVGACFKADETANDFATRSRADGGEEG